MIGRKLANFQINERLGEGGMGTVYRATDLTLNRAVAIKMLHPFLVNNPDSFKRFQNEAHLSARISHPNVATLFNFQEFEANHFIVMEYVKG
ncbi:MAG: protein kinase, partial [Bacteroidota bacterium]